MGYVLEFYSLSWSALRSAIQPNSAVLDRAERKWPQLRWELDPLESRWSDSISVVQKISGSSAPIPAAGTPLPDNAAYAFVSVVQEAGALIGALDHSSDSGEDFEVEFLEKNAAKRLAEPRLRGNLISRALLGLAPQDLPSWGGLSRAELTRIGPRLRSSGENDQGDMAVWMDELCAVLRGAVQADTDLVTLYM